jgi:predicted ATPase
MFSLVYILHNSSPVILTGTANESKTELINALHRDKDTQSFCFRQVICQESYIGGVAASLKLKG